MADRQDIGGLAGAGKPSDDRILPRGVHMCSQVADGACTVFGAPEVLPHEALLAGDGILVEDSSTYGRWGRCGLRGAGSSAP